MPRSFSPMHKNKILRIFIILGGVLLFIFKSRYVGPFQEVVWSYLGNIVISFVVYFIVSNLQISSRHRKYIFAILALMAVELFEVFNGFGLMQNVYDPVDLVANAVGVGVALGIDLVGKITPDDNSQIF